MPTATSHRVQSPLQRALASVPEHQANTQTLANLDALDMAQLAEGPFAKQLEEQLLELAEAGPVTLEQVEAELVPAIVSRLAAGYLSTAAMRVRNRLDTDSLRSVYDRHRDALLTALNTDLAETLATARTISDPGSLTSADAAVELDRVADFVTLKRAGERYELIRKAQSTVLGAHRFEHRHALEGEVDFIANLADLFGDRHPMQWLLERRTATAMQPGRWAPWGNHDRLSWSSRWPASAEFLRWALTSGAELWVPTLSERRAAARRLEDSWHDSEQGQTATDRQADALRKHQSSLARARRERMD